ncbi:N-formylglutamate amidohydrolase [Hyphomonas adhaerens]|nr:N-formylglutamate amidohydrolase [Hyphomonas adhaerens]
MRPTPPLAPMPVMSGPAGAEDFEAPYTLTRPAGPALPFLFASPHSGSLYPGSMLEALCVPVMDLRRTEDAFVEELFAAAPAAGASLLAARYARSVADLNRDPRELDPSMFDGPPPRTCGMPTARVDAGLGCLPRVAAGGVEIYGRRLTREEGEARLAQIHDAYHACLGDELAALRDTHGHAVLIDCHSMPSVQPGRRALADIVLGDRFGASCDPRLTGRAERAFRELGFSVARNAPYAGGYTTRRYGKPRRGVHALQIEINRGLYMDEHAVERLDGFDDLAEAIEVVIANLLETALILPKV